MSLCSSPNRSHNDISVWFSSGYFIFRSSFSKWRWKKRPKSSKIYSKRWVFDRFLGVFLIKWYSCVCSCNFTRQEGGWFQSGVAVQAGIDLLLQSTLECRLIGVVIVTVMVRVADKLVLFLLLLPPPPTPTPLAQHSNNHVTWCTATLFFGPVSVRTLHFDM